LSASNHLFDAAEHVRSDASGMLLPFEAAQVIDNLRYERYVRSGQRTLEKAWVKDVYYRFRPLMPVAFRKHLQGFYLRDRDRIQFPHWPVDRSVDILLERLLVLAMKEAGRDRLPFIWFWPDRHSSCGVMTHDVETKEGRDFCGRIMDIDDEHGIKGAFQIVPERRYPVPVSYLESIRERGFEINVQGLDHVGDLFGNREVFVESARKINQYAREYGARGFRSPALYRNTDWFQDLEFSYDMSVPSVARLEAQRGGCCTIMPYFLPGGMTELPVTMTEDYSLFHIMNDYSMSLWEKQMRLIIEGHGLMNVIVHPDYVTARPAMDVFRKLLERMNRLVADDGVWMTLPKEADRWWRERSQMKLVPAETGWKIEGPGSDRASVAFACVDGDRLTYEHEAKE